MNYKKKLFLLLAATQCAYGTFFRPTYLWDEAFWGLPIEINAKTGLSIRASHGSAKTGRNNKEETVNVLNIYGNENLFDIARGVPKDVLDKNPGSILNALWQNPHTPGLGQLAINGRFSLTEINIDFITGITKHWHIAGAVNFLKGKFKNICYKDLTPENSIPGSIGKVAWNNFFKDFASNMNKYGVNVPVGNTSTTGKEFEIYAGYAQRYKTRLGKVYWSATAGFADARPSNQEETILSLSNGLGDPKALLLSFSVATEPFKCFLFGAFVGSTHLKSQTLDSVRMKTFENQNGLIKLAEGKAKANYGTFTTSGMYARATLYKKWKIYTAYKYNHRSRTRLTPDDTDIFNIDVVNSDSTLDSWSMRVLNLALEYEQESENCTKTVALTLGIPLGGKNIFNTTMGGVGALIEYAW